MNFNKANKVPNSQELKPKLLFRESNVNKSWKIQNFLIINSICLTTAWPLPKKLLKPSEHTLLFYQIEPYKKGPF